MFKSWIDGVYFAVIATFVTGLLASIFARFNLKTSVFDKTKDNQ